MLATRRRTHRVNKTEVVSERGAFALIRAWRDLVLSHVLVDQGLFIEAHGDGNAATMTAAFFAANLVTRIHTLRCDELVI